MKKENLYAQGPLLYDNPLSRPSDVEDFIREGSPVISFPQGRLRLENGMDPALGQQSNYLFWCPVDFPDSFTASWDFYPIREPGLCMFFFAARGRAPDGRGHCDLFDPSLAPRTGVYREYNRGDIDTYHLSYFRRKQDNEREFHTCNLRKSKGFHLAALGADPIPSVADCNAPYAIRLDKREGNISFFINGLPVLNWTDEGSLGGPRLTGGKIGFRQMSPMIAEYANLKVRAMK